MNTFLDLIGLLGAEAVTFAYAIFGSISLVLTVTATVYLIVSFFKKRSETNAVSPFFKATVMIFVAVLMLLIPMWYFAEELEQPHDPIAPFWIAFLGTIRIFLADGDLADLLAAASTLDNDVVCFLISSLGSFLALLAPVLTFGNLLSLFKNLRDEAIYFFCFWKDVYILSELNERSLALGESIRENRKRALIVYTDVFEAEEESYFELLNRARYIRALCLKRDAAHLRFSHKKSTRLFLIGEDESENIQQAIHLTGKIRKLKNFETNKNLPTIYVYATSQSSTYIIDSLSNGNVPLNKTFENNFRAILKNDQLKNEEKFKQIAELTHQVSDSDANTFSSRISSGFSIRRIDTIEEMVLSTLIDDEFLIPMKKRIESDRFISILIVGMGASGKQFLKTCLWFFQQAEYRLEINVIDNSSIDPATGKSENELRFAQECPEIVRLNPSGDDGESHYDIRFLRGIDCFSAKFDELFEGDLKRRLKRTQAVFVALGNDDKNIETAITLRRMFDRINGVTTADIRIASADEIPLISAIVYDDKKSENVMAGLKNHKEQPIHIRFVGGLLSQTSFENLNKFEIRSEEAFRYHLEWVIVKSKLRRCYFDPNENYNRFRSMVNNTYGKGESSEILLTKKEFQLYDEDFYNDKDPDGQIEEKTVTAEFRKYINFEYFRRSSVARHVHVKHYIGTKYDCPERIQTESGEQIPNDVCECEICKKRRLSEHMRWNAYMRTKGYVFGKRNDRAKLHGDLKSWYELPYLERFKD